MQYIHYYTLLRPHTLPDLTLRCIMHDLSQCNMHYIAQYTNVQCAFCTLHFTRCALHIAHCTTSHGMAWHCIHGNTLFYILHSLSLYLSAMRIIHVNPTHAIHPIKPGLILLVAITLCLILVQQWHQTPSTNMVGPCEPPCISLHHMGTVYQICGSIFRGMASDPRMAKTIFLGGSKKFKAGKPNHFLCAISILFINASISFPLKWPFKWPFSLLVRITFRLKHFDEG